ncbi:MAG: hypothetical protein ACOX4R_07065 [Lentihominibacter sp.]
MEKITAKERQRLATLDRKIERLKEKVAVKHEEYNSLIKELSDLMDERYPERKEEHVKEALYKAYVGSELSLEEMLVIIHHAEEIKDEILF